MLQGRKDRIILASPNGDEMEESGDTIDEEVSRFKNLSGHWCHRFDWIIFGSFLDPLQNHWSQLPHILLGHVIRTRITRIVRPVVSDIPNQQSFQHHYWFSITMIPVKRRHHNQSINHQRIPLNPRITCGGISNWIEGLGEGEKSFYLWLKIKSQFLKSLPLTPRPNGKEFITSALGGFRDFKWWVCRESLERFRKKSGF